MSRDDFKSERHYRLDAERQIENTGSVYQLNPKKNKQSRFFDGEIFDFLKAIRILSDIKIKKKNPSVYNFEMKNFGLFKGKHFVPKNTNNFLLKQILNDLNLYLNSISNTLSEEFSIYISLLKMSVIKFNNLINNESKIEDYINSLKQMNQLKENYQKSQQKAA